jgi:ABC-2 type transport system permease protein
VTSPVWLIAEREFRTYVGTLSFWVALLLGSLAAAGGLLLLEISQHQSAPVSIQIVSTKPALVPGIKAALVEASAIEGRQFGFGSSDKTLTVRALGQDEVSLDFAAGFPLSTAGRSLVASILERDAARRAAGILPLRVHTVLEKAAPPHDGAALGRFLLMLMLWLTLTGSLGMLLQAVVRERATRALESLLASAQAWQIMAGKLIGVGGISLLVLVAWLASSMLSAAIAPQTGFTAAVMSPLTTPFLLLRAGVIFLLAYAFYGSITITLGAMARDSASAQNLSRPMFMVLVAAFFVAWAVGMGGMTSSHWLFYVPTFTPFLLLLTPAGAIPPLVQLLMLGVMAVASCLIARVAATRLALRDSGGGMLPRLK